MSSSRPATAHGDVAERFPRAMVDAGTDPAVAAELERRIEIIERDEAADESRRPFSGREIALYVGVSVVAVIVGAVMVAL